MFFWGAGGRAGADFLTLWLFDFVLSTWVLESLISSHRHPLPLPLQTSSSDQLRHKQSQVFLHVWAVRRGWQKRNFQEVAAIYTGPLSGASPQVLWCLETSLMSVTISGSFLGDCLNGRANKLWGQVRSAVVCDGDRRIGDRRWVMGC